MADVLPPEQQASYAIIIDQILAVSDLNTVSAKRIRKGLQDEVGYDLTAQKQAITDLIMERFDKYQKDHPASVPEPAPTTNGGYHAAVNYIDPPPPYSHASPPKRKVEPEENEDFSDIHGSPPPKKVKKVPAHETDEQMAKRMQAELNAQARATRGGGPKKKTPVRKQQTSKSKKKSAAKIRSDDDSDVEGSEGNKPVKERNTGFHKPMSLSEPLQALLGESQLSRPQTVKRIWEYVKRHDLQQPDDKRNILCDDALRAVFKSDKVHMFTMNKILAGHLYPVEE